ncbi:hypothetical protein BDK92_1187 [Micromonospora pisi]|uniref:Uncharacterized protein n=1 Tax=Micromonospora pisi TaxID=589240 RepID=A0A495JDC3_9ACTN|nr:hypothetical protein [Micromonospora pisi]RKR86915.1 hypothetical protein BDK92_1187 [Micromonospora pisi]
MSHAMKPKRPVKASSAVPRPSAQPSRPAGGFHLLPFFEEGSEPEPATDTSWAWTLRRFARGAVWILPGSALLYGLVTLIGDGPAPASADGRSFPLVLWAIATWLGVLALMALTGLLVTARSRGTATAGLLAALAGAMLMLPFAGLPEGTTVYGGAGRAIALTGASLYTLGWLLAGWAVLHSGVFSYSDGWLLMFAAPLIGIAGMFAGLLQTLGAFLVLAAGLGVAWRAGRLVPAVGRARLVRAMAGEAEVVAASVTPGNQLAGP